MVTKTCIFCLVLMVVLPSRCAPRSKYSKTAPQTVYDQKQTGDYNIQLHLKDFQIIALLSDDSIGSLGDYDYNYDYADFTVKPVTQKPSEPTTSRPTQTASNTQSSESQPTLKPVDHPYPILAPSTTQPPKETLVVIEENPAKSEIKPNKENILNEADKTETSTTTNGETAEAISSTSPRTQKNDESNSPGQIKVQIIGSPVNMGAVPGEEIHDKNNDAAPQGEVMQLRRCGTGFARDKKGRCRRVRRPGAVSPQLPYGFSRLATNLASKFRYTSSDTSQSSSSESTED